MLLLSLQLREIKYWSSLNLHHKMLHTVRSSQKVDVIRPYINHGGSELQTMESRHLHAYFNILSRSEIMKFKRKLLRNGWGEINKINKQTNKSEKNPLRQHLLAWSIEENMSHWQH